MPESSPARIIPKAHKMPGGERPGGLSPWQVQATHFPLQVDFLPPNCPTRATQGGTRRQLPSTLICFPGKRCHSQGPLRRDPRRGIFPPALATPRRQKRAEPAPLSPRTDCSPVGESVGCTDAARGSQGQRQTRRHIQGPCAFNCWQARPQQGPRQVQFSRQPFGTFSFISHGRWGDRGSHLGQALLSYRRQQTPETHEQTASPRGPPPEG